MKNLLFITVACLCLLAVNAKAEPRGCSLDQMLRSPVGQQMMKDELKREILYFWNNHIADDMGLVFLDDSETRVAWGVSDELWQQIRSSFETSMKAIDEHPEIEKLIKELETLQDGFEPFTPDVEEKGLKDFARVMEKLNSLAENLNKKALDNVLPPELRQKTLAILLVSVSEMPIISPQMFEALDLTDAQKQRMAEIKKEFTPEFEDTLEKYGQTYVTLTNKFFAEIDKQIATSDIIDIEGTVAKLTAENPEYKKVINETIAGSQAFTERFKTKIFDVLTDEQWTRFQELLDNPSEQAKKFREQLRKQRNDRKQAAPWLPNADLWKIGEAIPEAYRLERNTRRE